MSRSPTCAVASTTYSRAGLRSAIAVSIPRRSLRGEYLRKVAPDAHRQELEAGYIKGLIEEAPSVITLNMRAAAACANEFIARAYPFRIEPNNLYARATFSLAACEEEFTAEESFAPSPNCVLARGGLEPLLGLPALRPPREETSS